VYVKDGIVAYEFNLFEVRRTTIKATEKLPRGKTTVEVVTTLVDKIGGPLDITIKASGKVIAQGQIPNGISLHFSTNECFDIGRDTGSPVSLAYYDESPFPFNGAIGVTKVAYAK